ELIEAGAGWADKFREVLRGRDLEFCRILTARGMPLTVLPSADSADLIVPPLLEDFPLQVWLQVPGNEDRQTLRNVLHLLLQIQERKIHGTHGHQEAEISAKAAENYMDKWIRVAGCLSRDQGTESTANKLHELGRMHLDAKDLMKAFNSLQHALSMKRSLYGNQNTASIAKTLTLLGQATPATFHNRKFDVHFFRQCLDITVQCLDMYFTKYLPSDDWDEFLSYGVNREYEECMCHLRKYLVSPQV
ncbi:unnamed protein product, partial [Symbiodinium necroappetens]